MTPWTQRSVVIGCTLNPQHIPFSTLTVTWYRGHKPVLWLVAVQIPYEYAHYDVTQSDILDTMEGCLWLPPESTWCTTQVNVFNLSSLLLARSSLPSYEGPLDTNELGDCLLPEAAWCTFCMTILTVTGLATHKGAFWLVAASLLLFPAIIWRCALYAYRHSHVTRFTFFTLILTRAKRNLNSDANNIIRYNWSYHILYEYNWLLCQSSYVREILAFSLTLFWWLRN